MLRGLGAVILLAVSLAGCAVGPDYARPEVVKPEGFRFQQAEARELANVAWWKQFNDPVLDGLIDEALTNNYDLQIAAARVEEFAGRFDYHSRAGLSADRLRRERIAGPIQHATAGHPQPADHLPGISERQLGD